MPQRDKIKWKLRIPRFRYYLNGKQGADFCETQFSFEQISLNRSLTTLSQNVHKWALNTAVQRRMWVQKLWKCTLFFSGNRTGFPVNAIFRKYKTFSKNKFQVTWAPLRQFKSSVRINTLPQNPNTSEFSNARMKEKQKAFCLMSCYMSKNYRETSKEIFCCPLKHIKSTSYRLHIVQAGLS